MPARKQASFDVQAFLEAAGFGNSVATYEASAAVFSQGDPSSTVLYLREGQIRLSVVSHTGKEAVLATLSPGEFLGEGALAGHPVRLETATALTDCTVLVVPTAEMTRLLHTAPVLSDGFIAHLLTRNARLEADLVDHLFNPSEKRLARRLLLLARYGQSDGQSGALLPVSQETLAEMVGTTRSRVNFFLNKFRTLGFIDYDDAGITVRQSLLTVVIHGDDLQPPTTTVDSTG